MICGADPVLRIETRDPPPSGSIRYVTDPPLIGPSTKRMSRSLSGSNADTSVCQQNFLPRNPPWRVVLAPIAVGSPPSGSTDFAPPNHSGSRLGSNMIRATCFGADPMWRDAVTSIIFSVSAKRTTSSPAPDQPNGLIALEEIETGPCRLPAWTRKPAVTIKQELGVALRNWSKRHDILGRCGAECLFT